MITFRRVLAIPRDIHAWLYRDRIKAALDYENAHAQRADIRAGREAFDHLIPDYETTSWRRWTADGHCGCTWFDNRGDRMGFVPCSPEHQLPKPKGRHLRVVDDVTEVIDAYGS